MKTYQQQLDDWFQEERAAGRVLDIKFDLAENANIEEAAKAVYETVTGQRAATAVEFTEQL